MSYVLVLNDMRDPQIEMVREVAWAETEAELRSLLEREHVGGYRDGQWSKVFRAGGPLEWLNPPSGFGQDGVHDVGTEEDWAERGREQYREVMGRVPSVTDLLQGGSGGN